VGGTVKSTLEVVRSIAHSLYFNHAAGSRVGIAESKEGDSGLSRWELFGSGLVLIRDVVLRMVKRSRSRSRCPTC